MKVLDANLLNGSNLAYLGDAYYELMIRHYLLTKNITKSNQLQSQATKLVSAHAHYLISQKIFPQLTDQEQVIYKRGRNVKTRSHRKNLDLGEHNASNGLEALIGYWYLQNNQDRLNWIIEQAIRIIEDYHQPK